MKKINLPERIMKKDNQKENFHNQKMKNSSSIDIERNNVEKKLSICVGNKIYSKEEGFLDKNELIVAVKEGREEFVKEMIMKKAPLDSRDQSGKTALAWACEMRNLKVARILLEAGAFVDCVEDEKKSTPLIVACWKGHLEVVNLLIEFQANPSILNHSNETALIEATK